MAFIQQQDDEEKNQSSMNVLGQQAGGTPTPAQPSAPQGEVAISSGESATVGSGDNTPTSPVNKQPSSGLFTNVRSFLNANKGAGGQIATGVQKKSGELAQETGGAIQQKLGQYKQLGQQAQQQMQNIQQQAQQTIQNVAAGQRQVDPNQIQQFAAARRGVDTSGKMLSDVGKLQLEQEEAQKAQFEKEADLSKTSTGRFGLLRNYFGKNPNQRYTGGSQNLDAMLLQLSPEKANMAQALQQNAAQVGSQVTGARSQESQQAQQLRQQQEAVQQGIQSQAQQALTDIQSGVKGRLQSYQQKIADTNSAIQKYLSGKFEQISANEKQALRGLDQGTQEYLKNLKGSTWTSNLADVDPEGYRTNEFYTHGANDTGVAQNAKDWGRGLRIEDVITPEAQLRSIGQNISDLSRVTTQEDVDRANILAGILEGRSGVEKDIADRSFVDERGNLKGLQGSQYGIEGYQRARDQRQKDINRVLENEALRVGNWMNEVYYDQYGRHTGYGNDPGQRAALEPAAEFAREYGKIMNDPNMSIEQKEIWRANKMKDLILDPRANSLYARQDYRPGYELGDYDRDIGAYREAPISIFDKTYSKWVPTEYEGQQYRTFDNPNYIGDLQGNQLLDAMRSNKYTSQFMKDYGDVLLDASNRYKDQYKNYLTSGRDFSEGQSIWARNGGIVDYLRRKK